MILAATTSSLVCVLAGAKATNDCPIVATWSDITASGATPGETDGTTNGVTQANIVAAPAGSTQRFIKYVSVFNADTAAITITVSYDDNAILRSILKVTLGIGESLQYDGQKWQTYDATGAAKIYQSGLVGRFLKRTVLTTGTTFTTGSLTNTIYLRMVGGGGGGGGNSSVSSAASAAGGGGGGAYLEKTVAVMPSTGYTYAIGGAGAGNSGAAGGNGGSTTFAVAGTTYTAPGGTGGPLATSITTLAAWNGGAGGTTPTNGDINVPGEPGYPGNTLIVATPTGHSGPGGSSQFGSGGIAVVAAAAGVAATGYGGGGSGAMTGASSARAGGAGTAGCIIVEEYT